MIKKEYATKEEMCLGAFKEIKEAVENSKGSLAANELWVALLLKALTTGVYEPVLYVVGEWDLDAFYFPQKVEIRDEKDRDFSKRMFERWFVQNKNEGKDVNRFYVFAPKACWSEDGTPVPANDSASGFVIATVDEAYVRNFLPNILGTKKTTYSVHGEFVSKTDIEEYRSGYKSAGLFGKDLAADKAVSFVKILLKDTDSKPLSESMEKEVRDLILACGTVHLDSETGSIRVWVEKEENYA